MSFVKRGRWSVGDYLTHAFNPDLGIGRVAALDSRSLVVEFARAATSLRLAADTDALRPVNLQPGRPVRIVETREETTVAEVRADGTLRLANGRSARPDALWPLEMENAPLARLAVGDFDQTADFLARLRLIELLDIRRAGGLGSFLGGRVRLFPHQLYAADRACAQDPVRWLLADEVGLGKTVEAAFILNRLVHTRRVDRCLVVAPDALTVQWLGEMWRKYHQVFTLLDPPRLADVARDFGGSFNPFELHRRAIVALETLIDRPHLTEQAADAGIDLLIVDEAQRLRRPPGHPGEPGWRAVEPITRRGRHVVLLTATPLEHDAQGFFRLLQLLRPDEFPEGADVESRLAAGRPLPPCTSSTRRSDIGGLPPRAGIPIALGRFDGQEAHAQLERAVRSLPAANAVVRQQKVDRVRRALSSGAALRAVLGPKDVELRHLCDTLDRVDSRLAWLAANARGWRDAKEKTLVFVAHRETLELVRTTLGNRAQIASGMFHEDLPTARRDIEVARFREPDGPSVLVSTECGGEGRNFEFCRRLVLFDLPWKPTVVEQRIGRLDRIGRRIPVEVVYFQPQGLGSDVVRLFETLGVFREPLAGLEPQLSHIEGLIEQVALDPSATLSDDDLAGAVDSARAARTRIREAAYQQLHRDPYRSDLAAGILAKIPAHLDTLTESAIVAACERLGFTIERPSGRRAYSIELGNAALVDNLPGVPGGATFVGTFDREEAVERETLDFFASGHPLVEGVFSHFDESPAGRVVRLVLAAGDESAEGLMAVYNDDAGIELAIFDADGRPRPDWLPAVRRRLREPDDVPPSEDARIDWGRLVARVGHRLERARRLYAVAALVVRPERVRARA